MNGDIDPRIISRVIRWR